MIRGFDIVGYAVTLKMCVGVKTKTKEEHVKGKETLWEE